MNDYTVTARRSGPSGPYGDTLIAAELPCAVREEIADEPSDSGTVVVGGQAWAYRRRPVDHACDSCGSYRATESTGLCRDCHHAHAVHGEPIATAYAHSCECGESAQP